jgi:NADH-quinone oxidoreductase subunit C
MGPDDALRLVQEALGDRVTETGINFGQVDVTCPPENLVDVMTTLRDHDDLRCRFFTFLSGVDRSAFGGGDDEAKEGERHRDLEVLVHVYSPERIFHVNVHVPVPMERPVCPSITGVYAGAVWQERETWEMFGIHFPGHPKLVNLYLPEDFDGHPLLKSFKLPSRFVKEWPGAKDPEEAAAGGR